eukprot:CAMPEP_0196575014 /NCGR_PEP_ID=MMETSP1081-20130531/4595_1 /TAXON_ID=36882 /ORGANISM="Pyramimonas amylifera, Strain CCMP720" /LENGTH=163 /DNA_ID=CAMNT_0041893193 /DNA_START=268 /DNA_END=759 /DNA_ORIENTATION=-
MQTPRAAGDYVPSPMDASALTAQLEVLGAISVVLIYWWYVLVPNARVNLAVNKRKGKLQDYLVELKNDDSKKIERWFYSTWLEKIDPETKYLLRDDKNESEKSIPPAVPTIPEYKFEETLQEVIKNAKKAPKFWSGDNPVIVGTALTLGLASIFGFFSEVLSK